MQSESYDSTIWTWPLLLAHWTDFAGRAMAWPDAGDGPRLKASVADLVTLQAVWFALSHLHQIADISERALGLERAAWLIERHRQSLQQTWRDQEMPPAMRELMDDAQTMLRQVRLASSTDSACGKVAR